MQEGHSVAFFCISITICSKALIFNCYVSLTFFIFFINLKEFSMLHVDKLVDLALNHSNKLLLFATVVLTIIMSGDTPPGAWG